MSEPAYTFMAQALAGRIDPTEDVVDDWIDRWHEGDGFGRPLAEFLGFTPEEYAAMVENRASVADLVEARREASRLPTIDTTGKHYGDPDEGQL